MKSLFSDNRIINILSVLRKSSTTTIRSLASQLSVSERTIRNDIKFINDQLDESAVIEIEQGKCSLRIFNAYDFQRSYAELLETDDLMNSPMQRMKYIFGKLMRAFEPVLTDDLAYEMNVGRTTLISDLKKLREEIKSYNLAVIGKTSKGLTLQGTEADIRRYVLDNVYDYIYKDYPHDDEVLDEIERAFERQGLMQHVKKSVMRYLTLMLDRFLTGHYIGRLPDRYYDVLVNKEFTFVDRLINRIGNILHVEFPVEEKIFVLLPVIGMRTSMQLEDMSRVELGDDVRLLVTKIINHINNVLSIGIRMEDIGDEFLYHMAYMINRLQFRVKVDNPLIDDIQEKYPLAFSMAKLAADVIESEYDLQVTREELGYIASYFGIYLEINDISSETKRVALVCGTGWVTVKLLEVQLKKILDSSTILDIYTIGEVTTELLDTYDVVLSTIELTVPCQKPVIQIREIIDENDLRNRLNKAKYWEQSEMDKVDDNWFVMADVLDEDTFFDLNGINDYEKALNMMMDQLEEYGYIDHEFKQRIWTREAQGTMIFDHQVAVPHTFQTVSDSFVLALGITKTPISYKNQTVKMIFLLALPETVIGNEDLLIRIYDEILTLIKDEEMVNKITKANTFTKVLRVLYKRI